MVWVYKDKEIQVGNRWTDDNDIQHPTNWNIWDDDYKKKMGTNIFSACHNGHKYEPLSIMIYEDKYKTKVGEFGCIKHKDIKFLRASPDGINIDEKSKRFGRMVEVKNPVSRFSSYFLMT